MRETFLKRLSLKNTEIDYLKPLTVRVIWVIRNSLFEDVKKLSCKNQCGLTVMSAVYYYIC